MSYRAFLHGLLESPLAVSAPTPSSLTLSTRLAAEIEPSILGTVVELGPGSGVVTDALIKRGVTEDRLLLVESSGYFCELLRRKFPLSTVVQGNGLLFDKYLNGGTKVAGVLSGLPLLNFPEEQRRALIVNGLHLQGPLGRFVQLSYGWRPAIRASDSICIRKSLVWRNFPPAHIWCYSNRDKSGGQLPNAVAQLQKFN